MGENNKLKTEVYSIRYIICFSFIISFYFALLCVAVYFSNMGKVDFDTLAFLFFGITFAVSYVVCALLLLLTRKRYEFYCEDGMLIFQNSKNINKFDLALISKIRIGRTIYHWSISIVQPQPKRLRISSLIGKDGDFVDWLQREVENYKKENPKAEVRIDCKIHEKLHLMNLAIFS